MRILQTTGEALRTDAKLLHEVTALISPNYVDVTTLLNRELLQCSHIYLGRTEDGSLIGFFMISYESLALGAAEAQQAILHLGLSAAQHTHAGAIAIIRLYAQAIADAQTWEATHNTRLLIWTTTAAPMIYTVCAKYLADLEPRNDGSFTPMGSELATRIARCLGAQTSAHPFVLQGYATHTRYSPAERSRIAHTARASHFDLFQSLSVEERNGDRVLMIAHTPHEHPPRLFKTSSHFSVLPDLR